MMLKKEYCIKNTLEHCKYSCFRVFFAFCVSIFCVLRGKRQRICQDAWSEKRDISYLKSEEEILFKIVEANSAVYGDRSSIVAGNYLDYSVICREYEDKEKCSDYMQKAYDVFSDSLEEEDEWWIYIHLEMADNYKFLGDTISAYDELEKALEKSKAAGDEDLVSDIQKMLEDLKKSL